MSSCSQVEWNIIISILKQLARTRTDIELWPSGYSFPHAIVMYVASYNELEQLNMQVLLNYHSTAFCTVYSNFKEAAKQQFSNTWMCNCSCSL